MGADKSFKVVDQGNKVQPTYEKKSQFLKTVKLEVLRTAVKRRHRHIQKAMQKAKRKNT